MNIKLKKAVIVFSLAVAAAAFMTSCNDNKEPEYSNKVTYWVESAFYEYRNFAETPRAKKIMEKFDCEIEYKHPPAGQGQEKFNIMIAMGRLPDIIEYNWTSKYSGGAQKALSDGIIREIDIERDAPNLAAYLKTKPEIDNLIKTDDGKYYGYHFIRDDEYLQVSAGLIVREDWLKELGIEYPETIDDWTAMLTAFRDKKGAKAPLSVSSGVFANGCFVGAFGIGDNLYLDGGEVKYGPVEDAYKDFLMLMNSWYSQGLLDSDYVSLDISTIQSNILNGVTGASFGSCGSGLGKWMSAAIDESFSLTGVKYPVLERGQKPKFGQYQFPVTGTCASITRDCSNTELCKKILDYGYTEEGRMLFNFGIEGKSYTMVDGYPTYTDIITNNSEGLSMTVAMEPYTLSQHEGPFVQDKRYMEQYASLTQQKIALENWMYTDVKNYTMPSVTLTAEQRNEIAPLLESIDTYKAEMQAKFIMGIEPLDKFDDFCAELYARGLDKFLSYHQDGYERFLNR
ncbi:MAG: extracellular solute-binding protein [Clostridia bacterium]|nr:extracellular solute-binding protein [Clostridia bacterium]